MSATLTELRAVAVPINRSCALLGQGHPLPPRPRSDARSTTGTCGARERPRAHPGRAGGGDHADDQHAGPPDLAIGQIWARELG